MEMTLLIVGVGLIRSPIALVFLITDHPVHSFAELDDAPNDAAIEDVIRDIQKDLHEMNQNDVLEELEDEDLTELFVDKVVIHII